MFRSNKLCSALRVYALLLNVGFWILQSQRGGDPANDWPVLHYSKRKLSNQILALCADFRFGPCRSIRDSSVHHR
ncbi:hypothetical protein BDV96DRAFT_580640 [Lophiotrema nucula]|uniref:Secreted protein n=1 Tax=Lophiotrema nucula TaxID=690887 RepID=A0A6A5Z242_9PLEO|nr:hypothetical protein BDV96DRAFT_580640 [Lophiotrema nucula]